MVPKDYIVHHRRDPESTLSCTSRSICEAKIQLPLLVFSASLFPGIVMSMAIPKNIEAEYTNNGDSNLASHVHLLVQESVDSGSLPVVDDVILVKHSLQMILRGV